MKLLMENWRQYVTEDSLEKEFSLLLEQELNEGFFDAARAWIERALATPGQSKETVENTIMENVPPGISRRKLLQILATAAAGSVVGLAGMPKAATASAGYEDKCSTESDQEYPATMAELIRSLYYWTAELYKPGSVQSDRMIQLIVKKVILPNPKFKRADHKTMAREIYGKLYPKIMERLAPVAKFKVVPASQMMSPNGDIRNAFVRVQGGRDESGKYDERIAGFYLNGLYAWDAPGPYEDIFKRDTAVAYAEYAGDRGFDVQEYGQTRCDILSHEFVHAMVVAVKGATGGILDLEAESMEFLAELFDLPSMGIASDWKRQSTSRDEDEAMILAELYAEFKAFRNLIHHKFRRDINEDDLIKLCENRNKELGLIPSYPHPDIYRIHYLKYLKCDWQGSRGVNIPQEQLDAANSFAFLDQDLYGRQPKTSGAGATGPPEISKFAEQKELKEMPRLMENWREFLNEESDSYPLGEKDDIEPGTKALVFNEDGEILILKRASHMKWKPNVWDLPGGHLKEDEETVDGLKREVKEETGLTIKNIVDLGKVDKVTLFKCDASNEDREIKLDDENQDHKWVKPEDIPDDFVPFLKSHVQEYEKEDETPS